MPVLEETPPPFPPALFVATLAAGGALVALSYSYMRSEAMLGLEGAPLRVAVSAAALAFFSCLGYGGWRARRRARSR